MPETNHNDAAESDHAAKPRGLRAWARTLDTNALLRLIECLRPYVKTGLAGIAFTVAATLLYMSMLWLVKDLLRPIIDAEAEVESETITRVLDFLQPLFGQNALAQLTAVTILVLTLAFARSVALCGQIYFTNLVGQRLVADLRERVYAHLMRLSVGFFDNAKTGELMSRLTNDMNALQVMLVTTIGEMLTAPFMIIGGAIGLLCLSPQLTLLACVCLPLVVFLIRRAGAKMNWAASQSLLRLADLSDVMQERLSAIRVIHTFGTEATEVASFAERNQTAFRARMREVRVQATLNPSIELLAAVGLGFALWFGGREAIMGRLRPENIVAFVVIVQVIYSHFKRLGSIVLVLQQVSAASARIFAILDREPEIQDAPNAVTLPRLDGGVRFDHVHFRYNGGESVLHDVSFEIRPGEVVALVGSSGAGKTTVASLVSRLYDVTEGAITVDGYDLREVQLLSLRSQLGVVPQETLLFSGTVADNILYGKPQADDEELRKASRQANAAEFIETLEDGYDTVVGERGAKLSGGQRQRIAIARALLRDPRILILDEATSSLDAKSESLVQEALETLMANRTTLVIAHRLSSIRNADRILVLHEGRIVEEGTHRELMARNGHYARLYEIQTGKRLAETSETATLGAWAA